MFKVVINLAERSFKDRKEPWEDPRVLNVSIKEKQQPSKGQ